MRTSAVVVVEVLPHGRLKVTSAEDQKVVEAVVSDGAHEALGERVRAGGADRGLDRLDADRGEDAVERRGELRVPVAYKETEATACLFEITDEVAGDLGDPGFLGIGTDADKVDDPTFDFDHEQDVMAAEQHGVDGEEVGRQYALGLGAKELGPGRSAPPGWGPFRWNAQQAHDQPDGFLGQVWAPRFAVRIGPPSSHQGSMPAQDGLGRDEERGPALLRDEPRQGGDDRSVRPGEAGPCDLAAKDRHLVTQRQDLGVLGDEVHAVERQDLEDATDQAI